MTRWQEFPLRPQGRPWAGINTRSGKLDDGSGQMLDSSVNCIINAADKLEKRKGMVRGLDERFAGPVCGLHRYVDECGQEWLLVADSGGISIRQPFGIPTFNNSDAYPSDEFVTNGPVSPNRWINRSLYTQLGGSLVLATAADGNDLTWFKAASNFSYQIEFGYDLVTESTAIGIIKKAASGSRIEGRVVALPLLDPNEIQATLVWVDSIGSETTLLSTAINIPSGIRTGVATLRYLRDLSGSTNLFRVTFVVQPTGESAVTLDDSTSINALADSDLGQGTALRLERDGSVDSPKITYIQGSPI